MGGNHGVSVQRCVPLAYSGGDLRIAFAAGRHGTPTCPIHAWRRRPCRAPAHRRRSGLPIRRMKSRQAAHRCRSRPPSRPSVARIDFHGFARADERTRNVVEVLRRTAVAANRSRRISPQRTACAQPAALSGTSCRPCSRCCDVPVGEAVADVIDDGPWHELIRIRARRVSATAQCRSATLREDSSGRAPWASRHSLLTSMSGASGCFIPTM